MSKNVYGEDYYKFYSGMGYDRNVKHWFEFFGNIADRIIKEFDPDTVLDTGCAKGFLVEILRDRGVKAYGIDISEYAISEVRDDIRPYCRVASITEADSFSRDYDLITCIEVLEHLTVPEGKKAIKNICNHTDTVIFSSSPDDFEDCTHINVRPIDYWVRKFKKNGFTGDFEHDLSYVSPHAVLFNRNIKKQNTEGKNKLREYEKMINKLKRDKSLLETEIREIKDEKNRISDLVTEIVNSNSWKTTKPLRVLGRFVRNTTKKCKQFFLLNNIRKGFNYFKCYGLKQTFYKIKSKLNEKNISYDSEKAYQKWIEKNENYNVNKVKDDISNFTYKPKISIIIPVYNVEEEWLRKCIDSVRNQYYDNWELCLADDNSTVKHIKPLLKEYRDKDKRIKVVFRQKNGHISKASNSALKLATGEFIALLDNDDELPLFALYEVVKLLNEHPQADLIYSDEDKIDTKGKRKDPHFKPDWSPDTLLSCNYITHLGVYRKEIIDDIGGFRVGYEGSQDYDLVLRFTEKTDEILHIPKILYHWRLIEGSTSVDISGKNYAYKAGFKALEDTIKRRKYNAEVKEVGGIPFYNIIFKPAEKDFVSIIIPTRDKSDILSKCLESIYEKTHFKRFEVIVVDNGSSEKETFKIFNKYQREYNNLKVLKLNIPFNFSKLNNKAAELAKGNLLLFLNNDIEVITQGWLEIMVGQARRSKVGAVGAKLLYPDNKVQHAGVILGMGGVAAHANQFLSADNAGYFARNKVNYNYSAVTAACLIVKKSIFKEVNGFEEELAVVFNDIDFCLKIIEKDYYNLFLPGIELYYHESKSRGKEDTPEKLKRFNDEVNYMNEKWRKLLDNDPFYNPNLSLDNPYFHIRI